MIKKFVLAFLLLFFSSVSFASFQFYFGNDAAIAACQADVAIFQPLVTNTSTVNYEYSCGFVSSDLTTPVQTIDSTVDTYALFFRTARKDPNNYYAPWVEDANSPVLMTFYSICNAPKSLDSAASTYKGHSYSNSCTDTPSPKYKKWFKSKALAYSACSSDQYDSKFLALIPDGSADFLMCPESSTDVKLTKGVDISTAEIINEYTVCSFPQVISATPANGYVNSCGAAPPDGDKTSCKTGQILYKGNCYDVTNASTGSTSTSSTGSTGASSTGASSTGTGDTGTGSTGTGSTDTGTGSTGTGSTGTGDTGTGSTGTGLTDTGTGSTGSTGGDTSFTCADGSVISPPLDCPKQYCGYINNQYACYDAVGNIGSTGSTGTTTGTSDTGSTSTGGTGSTGGISTGGTGTGTTGTGSTGSTGTGDTEIGTTGGTGSTGGTSTGDTGTGTTGTGSTGSTGTGTGTGGLITCDGGIPVGPNGSCSSGGTGTGTSGTGSTGTTGTGSTGMGTGTSGTDSTGSTGTGSTGTTPSTGKDGSGDCSTLAGAIDCLKGQGTAKTVKTGEKGGFGTAADTALTQAKTDLNNKMTEVKSGLKGFMPKLSAAGRSLPVWNFGTIRDVEIKLDLNDYADSLGVISSAVIFLATVMAFRIVLGG